MTEKTVRNYTSYHDFFITLYFSTLSVLKERERTGLRLRVRFALGTRVNEGMVSVRCKTVRSKDSTPGGPGQAPQSSCEM